MTLTADLAKPGSSSGLSIAPGGYILEPLLNPGQSLMLGHLSLWLFHLLDLQASSQRGRSAYSSISYKRSYIWCFDEFKIKYQWPAYIGGAMCLSWRSARKHRPPGSTVRDAEADPCVVRWQPGYPLRRSSCSPGKGVHLEQMTLGKLEDEHGVCWYWE